jgi:Rho termination factor, N-terminal domain
LTDYSKLNLDALKMKAQDLKIKGRSKMNKSELIEAINSEIALSDKLKSALDNSAKGNVTSLGDFRQYAQEESFIEGIKASIRNAKEARSNKGRKASAESTKTAKVHPQTKALKFALQRGSESAKLTSKQARRVRKTENRMAGRNVCTGMGA